ncbi:MAG TPA: S8 family serine peptidase [Phototrophicaceae bacterium]|jgi:subtilisin family serine protease|nr:S8 family serine peptidase [Phototrophicaceae bacterium]
MQVIFKRKPFMLLIAITLALSVISLFSINLSTAQSGKPASIISQLSNKTDRNQLAAAAAQGVIRVIVGLDMDTFSGKTFATLLKNEQLSLISGAQQTLLSNLTVAGVLPRNIRQYIAFPYLTMTVDSAGLKTLSVSPLVNYIQLDGMNFASLDTSTYQIGAAGTGGVWEMGYDGTGQTIAILDTGVDKHHSFLTEKVVSEACYGTTDTFYDPYFGEINIVSNCPGGQDTTAPDSGLNCIADGCYHGTHVAGIAAGSGSEFSGVAKGADLIAIQVFSKITTESVCTYLDRDTPCITAFDSDIIGGLDRVYALHTSFDIASVNLSLGGGQYSSQSYCDADNAATKSAIDTLRSAAIAVVISAGNSGYNGSLSAPACISSAISVGAVDDFDIMPGFSNEATFLDLIAPGVGILSSLPGDTFAELTGTSMSAPHVAGAWAILKQFVPGASVGKVEKALRKTGIDIPGSTGSYPRIQVNKALVYLTKPGKPTLVSPLDHETISGIPLTFSWSATDNTTLYGLAVKDHKGKKVVDEMISPDICLENLCSYSLVDPLPKVGKYKWFVKTYNQYHENQSDKSTLIADYPGAPTLQQPEDGAVLTDKSQWTVLQWSLVENATTYKVAVKDTKTGEKFVKATLTAADCVDNVCSYLVTEDDLAKLRNHHIYKWSVQASNDLGVSKSEKFSFSADFPK